MFPPSSFLSDSPRAAEPFPAEVSHWLEEEAELALFFGLDRGCTLDALAAEVRSLAAGGAP